ncbi:MAG: hypothetical protein IT323_13575 [Anaerolineae bacterium]|nr:hypothetical protein [Anaerolineae bacterium]
MKLLRQITEDVSNVALDDGQAGVWSVIVPDETTNMVVNPSFEVDAASWGATWITETIARVSTHAHAGAWSLEVTPTGDPDLYEGATTVIAGSLASHTYTVSLWFLGAHGVSYRTGFGTPVLLNMSFVLAFKGTGEWQRIEFTSTAPGAMSPGALALFVAVGEVTTAPFYIDQVQVEEKPYATTYCDGDQDGCVWTGLAHYSASQRGGYSPEGGRVRNLREFHFTTAAIIGAGAPPQANIIDAYALVGGGNYQRSIVPPHSFSIVGRFECDSTLDLKRARQALYDAIKPRRTPRTAPIHLIYQPVDCGKPVGREIVIECVYRSGLEGNHSANVGNSVALEFDLFDGLAVGRAVNDSAALLAGTATVQYTKNVMRRVDGQWKALGRGVNDIVYAIAKGPGGLIYVGGSFTQVVESDGTIYASQYIAQWTPMTETWANMTPAGEGTGPVRAVAVAPNGEVYLGGSFTNWGFPPIGAADNIVKWNGIIYEAVGTGCNSDVSVLAFGPDGMLYAGGTFTLAGGVANTAYIAKWDGSAWSALGTGANDAVFALAFDASGMYAGGDFTSIGGVAATRVAKWNGVAWSALGSGANGLVMALAVAPDGTLYAGGLFTTIGGVSASRIARWTGAAWEPLGSGCDGNVLGLAVDSKGLLYVVGEFTSAGGMPTVGFATWNGSVWVRPDADSPGNSLGYAVAVFGDGFGNDDVYLGFDGTDPSIADAETAGYTEVVVGGTAEVYPRVAFSTPGLLSRLTNFTTGESIYFNNTILDGERAVLKLGPSSTFASTFRISKLNGVLPGSNLATWRLVPGVNKISLLGPEALMVWHEQFDSIDGAAL